MFKSEIITNTPPPEVPVPSELVGGVERASAILNRELRELTTYFDIEARWKFGRTPQGDFEVLLTLKAENEETGHLRSLDYLFPESTFLSEQSIRRDLRLMIVTLGISIYEIIGEDLQEIRDNLELLATTPGE